MNARLVLVALLMAGCAAPQEGPPALPDSVAALGDSISRAANAQGDSFADFPTHGWSTGTNGTDPVLSHYERLQARSADVVAFNDARSGARMADLAEQAEQAARQRAQYVTILMGANDACTAQPTPVETFRAQFVDAAETLDPLGATVFVASVPDVTKLRALFEDHATARAIWNAFDVCPGVLGDGADPAAARERIRAYNAVLREETLARGWTWDEGAVFEAGYEEGDVSEVDYFHPSLAGQAKLAALTWSAGPYAIDDAAATP